MSDASPDHKLGPPRPLRKEELDVIKKMVSGTSFETEVSRQLGKARVQDMADGGMGSIRCCKADKRRFGKEIAKGAFQDADGVPVSVTLNLDQQGELFELDVWKVDNSPLVRYPDLNDFRIVKRHPSLGAS
jgi:hypothetical protein